MSTVFAAVTEPLIIHPPVVMLLCEASTTSPTAAPVTVNVGVALAPFASDGGSYVAEPSNPLATTRVALLSRALS